MREGLWLFALYSLCLGLCALLLLLGVAHRRVTRSSTEPNKVAAVCGPRAAGEVCSV